MVGYLLNGVRNRLAPVVLGQHPRNTIFSFNYTNVRHLAVFMKNCAETLPGSGLTVVDVGAGRLPYFADFSPKVARYLAIDYDETLAEEGADDRVHRSVGAAEALPVGTAVADAVLMNQVLEHVECPEKSFAEVRRVLRPAGLFFGSVPHISPVHLEPHDFRRYTDLGVRQLLERHGFEVLSIEPSGGVFSAAALLLNMDWVLGGRQDGRPQQFSDNRAFWGAPVVGMLNVLGLVADRLFGGSRRSPANLGWIARRHPDSSH